MSGEGLKAGLIGQGIAASLTPAMQESEARAHGLSLSYLRFDTLHTPWSDKSLSDLIHDAQADGFVGLNVTHPYKVAVLEHLDKLSDAAQRIGAINTIVFDGHIKVGHNTDYLGFKEALLAHSFSQQIKTVLLLGAGGAAAAIACAILDSGVERLLIYDQVKEKTNTLCRNLTRHAPATDIVGINALNAQVIKSADGIVNSTPMGMHAYPGEAIDVSLISKNTWVCDIVYFPLETSLLSKCKAKGCQVINGSFMAVGQAAASFELFTGKPADRARMFDTFTAAPPVS